MTSLQEIALVVMSPDLLSPVVSAPGDYDFGEIGGMIGKGN
jgi:hypothetical protein